MKVSSDTDVTPAGSATVVQTKAFLMEVRSGADVQAKEPQMEARTDTTVQPFFISDGGSDRY